MYTPFVMMLIFLGLLIVVCILIYIIYLLRTSNYRSTKIVETTTRTNKTSSNPFFNGTTSLAKPYGKSFTFSFWLYINELRPSTTGSSTGKSLVWMSRGNSSEGAPLMVIFMDSATNRFYISVANTSATSQNVDLNDLVPTSENPGGAVLGDKYLTFMIDYIPIQRWVQISIVMMDASNVSVYQDNALRAVRTPAYFESRALFNIPDTMYLKNTCENNSSCNTTLDAYLSTFVYYNYAVSFREIERIYSKGPDAIDGWWSWLGLGNYRLQWPIVSVDENGEDLVDTVG